jgi:hypothetical protein
MMNIDIPVDVIENVRMLYSIGNVSRDFWPLVLFFAQNPPGYSCSWATAVSNTNSYSRRYSTPKIDSTLCNTARSHLHFRSANSQPYAKGSLKIISVTQVKLIDEKNRGSKISRDCSFEQVTKKAMQHISRSKNTLKILFPKDDFFQKYWKKTYEISFRQLLPSITKNLRGIIFSFRTDSLKLFHGYLRKCKYKPLYRISHKSLQCMQGNHHKS